MWGGGGDGIDRSRFKFILRPICTFCLGMGNINVYMIKGGGGRRLYYIVEQEKRVVAKL